jgi:hypothetical protein
MTLIVGNKYQKSINPFLSMQLPFSSLFFSGGKFADIEFICLLLFIKFLLTCIDIS